MGTRERYVRQERNFHQDNGSVRIIGVEDLPHKTCDTWGHSASRLGQHPLYARSCGWEARCLQHTDCKYNRNPNLPPHGHLQVPYGNKWNSKHHEVREHVDDRGGDEEGVGIDACFARDLFLVDTLKDHDENQGDAVEKVEPDYSPWGEPYLGLLRLGRDKYSDSEEQNGELGEEDGDSGNNLDIPKKLQRFYECQVSRSQAWLNSSPWWNALHPWRSRSNNSRQAHI